MQSTVRVATPPAKPLMLYDGDCHFCTTWICRWQRATEGKVDNLPSRDPQVRASFPEIPREQFEAAVQLILPDGSVLAGAEAVFCSLAANPRHRRWLAWYERSRLFARSSEFLYRFVARHRTFFSLLTRIFIREGSESRRCDLTPADSYILAPNQEKQTVLAIGPFPINIENERRSITRFLASLSNLPNVQRELLGPFDATGGKYSIPRFTLRGSNNSDPIRIGIFAAIHGDEPAGALAAAAFLAKIVQAPKSRKIFFSRFTPSATPPASKTTRAIHDAAKIEREFSKASTEPEVVILEHELRTQHFSGIIQLHADDTSGGIYGFVHGHTLTENLLRPALREAGKVLPRNFNAKIDGFAARDGIIYDHNEGILAAPKEIEPAPFEIILETPHLVSLELQVQALVVAMSTILPEYRRMISFAANL